MQTNFSLFSPYDSYTTMNLKYLFCRKNNNICSHSTITLSLYLLFFWNFKELFTLPWTGITTHWRQELPCYIWRQQLGLWGIKEGTKDHLGRCCQILVWRENSIISGFNKGLFTKDPVHVSAQLCSSEYSDQCNILPIVRKHMVWRREKHK